MFNLLDHSSNGCHGQNWAKLKQGARSQCFCVFHMGSGAQNLCHSMNSKKTIGIDNAHMYTMIRKHKLLDTSLISRQILQRDIIEDIEIM